MSSTPDANRTARPRPRRPRREGQYSRPKSVNRLTLRTGVRARTDRELSAKKRNGEQGIANGGKTSRLCYSPFSVNGPRALAWPSCGPLDPGRSAGLLAARVRALVSSERALSNGRRFKFSWPPKLVGNMPPRFSALDEHVTRKRSLRPQGRDRPR